MRTVPLAFCMLAVLAACAQPEPDGWHGVRRTGDRAADEAACRAAAERRFADIPAVSSGQTSYITGAGPDALRAQCMRALGYTG